MHPSHRPALICAAGAAFLLRPDSSLAQTVCPAPSLVQCRDAAYLATDCGRQALTTPESACSVLLRGGYQTQMQRADVSVEEVTLPDSPEATAAAGTTRYSFSKHLARRFNGEFLGTAQRTQLWRAGSGLSLFADLDTNDAINSLKAQRQRWEQNGAAVQSCTEYVHERYADYTRFRDLADTELLSDPSLYDSVFDPDSGIADKTLRSKSSQPMPALEWPSNGVVGTLSVGGVTRPLIDRRAPKNGFFQAYRALSRGAFFGPGDEALRRALQTGFSHHVVDWNWHRQMQANLSAYHGETLRHFEELQQDFLRLVAQRDKLLDGSAAATAEAAAELSAVEAGIRSMLEEASAQGCLELTSPTVCDWSYHQLRDHLARFYSPHMESDFQACVSNTASDFGANAPIRNAAAVYGAPKNDYTQTPEDVERFAQVIADWGARQSFPLKPNGKPMLGDQKSDRGRLGSDDLSLEWGYDTSWEVTGLSATAQACNANLRASAAFDAQGHAYGTDLTIIDAQSEVFTEKPRAKARVRLQVLGAQVWNRWDNPYQTELQTGLLVDLRHGTEKEFTTTVVAFGIPVTLGAGIGMQVGLKFDTKAQVGGACDTTPSGSDLNLASITGTITPSAEAKAFASAAVGLPGFRAGAKCNLILVRGEMPFAVDARIAMQPSHAVMASLSLNGRQRFRMLDGNLKAFIDAPFSFLDSEWTLFSWQGPHIDQEVFAFQRTLPLDAVKRFF